jgi:hypothetical protein
MIDQVAQADDCVARTNIDASSGSFMTVCLQCDAERSPRVDYRCGGL